MPGFAVTPNSQVSGSATFVDASGLKATMGLDRLPDTVTKSLFDALRDAAANVSNAALVGAKFSETDQVATAQGVAFDEAYASISVKLVMEYQREDMALRTIEVPAPDASVFLTDGNTVDIDNALVSALNVAILAVINNGLTIGDPGYHRFTRGYRSLRSRTVNRPGTKPTIQEPDTGSSPPQDPASEPGP